jgi:hypothetical protein
MTVDEASIAVDDACRAVDEDSRRSAVDGIRRGRPGRIDTPAGGGRR